MAKSFFTPIDLPEPPEEDNSADPSVEDWPTFKLFEPILDRIAIEIDRITAGTSKFTPHGIQLDRDRGFMNIWDKFKNAPTKENLELFLQMIEQDVNLRARQEISEWLDLVLKRKK